jgi:hypothetical protein
MQAVQGKNPTGNYGPARYLMVDPSTSTWLAEWPSLEATEMAFLEATLKNTHALREALEKSGVPIPDDK